MTPMFGFSVGDFVSAIGQQALYVFSLQKELTL